MADNENTNTLFIDHDVIQAEPVTQRILKHYFLGIPTENRDDLFDYIRNYILYQQETCQVYVHEEDKVCVYERGGQQNSEHEVKDETETEDEEDTDTSQEDDEPGFQLQDNESESGNEPGVSFYTSHKVDSMEIYFQVRALFEETTKRPFVSYAQFYEDVFMVEDVQES